MRLRKNSASAASHLQLHQTCGVDSNRNGIWCALLGLCVPLVADEERRLLLGESDDLQAQTRGSLIGRARCTESFLLEREVPPRNNFLSSYGGGVLQTR
eukprot:3444356-Pleurochrysis_carterae.AAC.1